MRASLCSINNAPWLALLPFAVCGGHCCGGSCVACLCRAAPCHMFSNLSHSWPLLSACGVRASATAHAAIAPAKSFLALCLRYSRILHRRATALALLLDMPPPSAPRGRRAPFHLAARKPFRCTRQHDGADAAYCGDARICRVPHGCKGSATHICSGGGAVAHRAP